MPVIRACSHCGQKNRIPAKYLASTGRCGACKSPLPSIAEPLAVDDALFDEVVRIPNFVVLSRGRVVMQQPGVVSHDQMEQWLRSAAPVSA